MTPANLIDNIAFSTGVSKVQVRAILAEMVVQLGSALAQNQEAVIPHFGKFKPVAKPERTGRNPATGASLVIPAHRVVKFAPAMALKQRVAGVE